VAFEAGQCIVTEGENGNIFYLITNGEVTVSRQKTILRTLQKGEHFGEGESRRPARCEARKSEAKVKSKSGGEKGARAKERETINHNHHKA
jgi:CRP-like cAMP-binding protein